MRSSRMAALGLAGLFTGSGILHFVKPHFFDGIVPRVLPGDARFYTLASGVAELAVAGALLPRKTRPLAGLAATGLLVGVFPANVQMAVDWVRDEKQPLPMKIGAVARLPLQWPMITTAWKVARSPRL